MRDGLLVAGWKFLHHPPVRESPFMTHANAPLTPTGLLRMVHRHLYDGVPQAHVATKFRVSRLAYTEALEDEKAATGNGANYAGVGLHPHRGSTGQQALADPPLHATAQL